MNSQEPAPKTSGPTSWSDSWVLWFGRGFGSGQIPVAPGTFGTLAGVLLVWGLKELTELGPASDWTYGIISLIVFLVGIPICTRCEQLLYKHDPSEIVIDEIAAILIVMAPFEFNWKSALCGFAFFRLFDILKPWPVSWADKKVNGLGIMLDDLVAAGYAILVMFGLHYLQLFS